MITFSICLAISLICFLGTWNRKLANDNIRLKDENFLCKELIKMMSTEDSLSLIIGKLDQQGEQLSQHGNDLSMIKRGMYGDPANGVMGLIQRQDKDEQRLEKLEEFKKGVETKFKRVGIFAGALSAIATGAYNFKEYLIKLFQ